MSGEYIAIMCSIGVVDTYMQRIENAFDVEGRK
jgi:hypothetical protein